MNRCQQSPLCLDDARLLHRSGLHRLAQDVRRSPSQASTLVERAGSGIYVTKSRPDRNPLRKWATPMGGGGDYSGFCAVPDGWGRRARVVGLVGWRGARLCARQGAQDRRALHSGRVADAAGRGGLVGARAAEAIGSNGRRNSASVSSTKVRMPRCNKDQVGIGLGASRRGWGVTKFTRSKHMRQHQTARKPIQHMPQVPVNIDASRNCNRSARFVVRSAHAQASACGGFVRVAPEVYEPAKHSLSSARPVRYTLRRVHHSRAKVTATRFGRQNCDRAPVIPNRAAVGAIGCYGTVLCNDVLLGSGSAVLVAMVPE